MQVSNDSLPGQELRGSGKDPRYKTVYPGQARRAGMVLGRQLRNDAVSSGELDRVPLIFDGPCYSLHRWMLQGP